MNEEGNKEDIREADPTLELARAVMNDSHGNGGTSNETLGDSQILGVSPGVSPGERPRNKRADNSNGAPSAWKRSLPKALTSNSLQLSPGKNERKGPEPVHRSESLMSSHDSFDNAEANGLNGSSEATMMEYIQKSNDLMKQKPLNTIKQPGHRRTSSGSTLNQLAPIAPPAVNADPLAAKTILDSLRREINPSKELNIISTLNILDNQMAMAGIGIHSRAALFVSLLEDSAKHAILNKTDLANNWEALRAYLVENRSNRAARSDVMENFMQCARSVTAGNAEPCARLAVEQLSMMPATPANIGIRTFVAAIPDKSLRDNIHELYEMTLSSQNANSEDEDACIAAFLEAAKKSDRQKSGRLSMNYEKPKRGHRREASVGSITSEKSRSSKRGTLHNRGGSSSFQSDSRTPRIKRSATRVYDRMTGEEHVVQREVSPQRDGFIDDDESVRSGRSGRSGKHSISRHSTVSGMFDNESKKGKSIVTVYSYPKDLPLAQLVELTTPPAGRAPVMIRHKDGLVKVLYSNAMAAQEVTKILNNCTVNNVSLGATCELRGLAGTTSSIGEAPAPTVMRSQTSPIKSLPSFASKADNPKNGPSLPKQQQQPVFPEKEDIAQLWNDETYIYVAMLSLMISAICSGFGNGFEANSPLALMHIFFLLIGFEFFNRGMDHTWHGFIFSLGIVIVTQSLGSMLGFAYFFSYPNRNAITVNVSLLFSAILWIANALVAVMLEYSFRYKFPDSTSVPFVFPAAHTMVTTVMFGERFGTFFALGNAVIDLEPLRQVSAAFGIGGVHFISVLIPTLLFLKVIKHEFKAPISYTVFYYCIAILVLVTTMSFIGESDYLYQRSVVASGYHTTVPVSCITGRDYEVNSDGWNQVLSSTSTRIAAGDAFVLWSDRTLSVSSDADEDGLLAVSQDLVRNFGSNSSYLGIAYQRIETSRKVRDMFYLVGPQGVVVMKHQKVLPIPFLDDNVVESGDMDFVSREIDAYGRVGLTLGFEMSNPTYMRQAGEDDVDIVLQPLWSHAGLGRRRFDTDSIRAIENGFTLFRCDSNGVSGVVSPRGEILSKEYVAIDPTRPNLFSLPIRSHVTTFYNTAGFSFDYICTAFACLYWVLVLTPWFFIEAIKSMFAEQEKKDHNFIITQSGEEYVLAEGSRYSSTSISGDGNPFADVSATVLREERDSEEDEGNGVALRTYYGQDQDFGDEV